MRTATAIRTGVVLAVAVVLGLMVAPAAHALWSVFVPSEAGTIQAADFSVEIIGAPNAAPLEMVPDGEIALASLTGLYPGASVTTGVWVANTTNAGSDFTIRITVPEAETIPSDLAGHLTLKYATATSVDQCASLDATQVEDRNTFAMSIAKGDTAVLCTRIELASAALQIPAVDSARIAVPLQAAQIGSNP